MYKAKCKKKDCKYRRKLSTSGSMFGCHFCFDNSISRNCEADDNCTCYSPVTAEELREYTKEVSERGFKRGNICVETRGLVGDIEDDVYRRESYHARNIREVTY